MKKKSPVFPDGLVFALTVLTTFFILTACSSPVVKATEPVTALPSATASMTPTPEPTPTPTPVVLEGRLFFDMNGSGLRDEASFQYDAARLSDERQPLQADLLVALTAYLAEHPELKDGDLVTLEEPGLSGYTVCAKSNCVTTDAEGVFQLVQSEVESRINITIKDPNAGTPALEMRYTNKWKGEVTVPEYTREVDAATMGQLSVLPDCGTDADAMVCKQDTETLLVREQHLNDTAVFKLSDGFVIAPEITNEIGLMNGFLTMPFVGEESEETYIFDFFDIIGNRLFNSTNNYFNSMDGKMMTYNGEFTGPFSPDPYIQGGYVYPGVADTHNGIDIFVDIGDIVLLGSPSSVVGEIITKDGENLIQTKFKTSSSNGYFFDTYGHLSTPLIKSSDDLYRGQIIGLSGNTGYYSGRYPQLHFDIYLQTKNGSYHYDPFRYTVVKEEALEEFWGSEVSFWTADNLPIYSK